jgi:hypothetical protein
MKMPKLCHLDERFYGEKVTFVRIQFALRFEPYTADIR